MKVSDILQNNNFSLLNNNSNLNNTIHNIFSSDLLSHVMGYASEEDLLITVLNNINVLGVASLLDLSCVIFSHGITVNKAIIDKANQLDIPLISTRLSSADAIIELHKMGVG